MSAFTKQTVYDDRPLTEQTVNSILENRAEELGERAFVRYGPERHDVSFQEMNQSANSIGNALQDIGIKKQEKVSLLMRNPLAMLFAMFGINKAGAVYSPINFDYEGQILAYQLNDTAPEALVIEDQYVERLNAIETDLDERPHLLVRETSEGGEPPNPSFTYSTFAEAFEYPTSKPDVFIECIDEASIVYTSGTTGRPKGVVLPHRWIFANYVGFGHELMNEDDVVHTSLPLYHVGGVYADVVAALVSGAQVGLWNQFSTSDFWDRIERYQATRIHLLSVMMPWLMKQPESPDDHRNTLNKVHMQPLPDNYDELAERFGFDIVTAGFGQTESGAPIGGVIHAVEGENATPSDLQNGIQADEVIQRAEALGIPVVEEITESRFMGKPRTNIVDVAIVNENDEQVPAGEVGELVVRPKGAGIVLKEYYGKPQRTVEAFRNLWFHTGDSAYRDEDGYFYFVDRIGDVIRRRGENISSIQIQDVLTGHEAVEQAAVFPISADEGGEDLIGAAVEAEPEQTEDELYEYLCENLPKFMIPDRLQILEEIPTTETNKMEKYKLRTRFEGTNE